MLNGRRAEERGICQNEQVTSPDFLFGLKAEGSKVLHLSSRSDGSCFDGPLEAVSLHRL